MSYPIPDIIQWAKASQALSAIGEANNLAYEQGTIEENLHVKLYTERKSLEYSYAQDPTSNQTYQIGQGVLALCGVYLFEAQAASGGGGSITPVIPGSLPDPIEFEASASTPIPTGGNSLSISTFIGYNLIFVYKGQTQTTLSTQPIYFTWNKTTGNFSFSINVQEGDLIQLYPTA